jgi:hypothetical protein
MGFRSDRTRQPSDPVPTMADCHWCSGASSRTLDVEAEDWTGHDACRLVTPHGLSSCGARNQGSEDPPQSSSASALLQLVRQHCRFDSGVEALGNPRTCSRSNRGTSTHRRTGHTRNRLHVQVQSRGSSITSSAVTWSLLGVLWCVRSQEGSVISSSQELWSPSNKFYRGNRLHHGGCDSPLCRRAVANSRMSSVRVHGLCRWASSLDRGRWGSLHSKTLRRRSRRASGRTLDWPFCAPQRASLALRGIISGRCG